MNKGAPIVDVRNLSVQFGDFFAVRDVSFRVGAGEIFGFLGANGAGKTTTIRVLCGLLPASSGRVVIDGAEFTAGRKPDKAKGWLYVTTLYIIRRADGA